MSWLRSSNVQSNVTLHDVEHGNCEKVRLLPAHLACVLQHDATLATVMLLYCCVVAQPSLSDTCCAEHN